ncbi:MAG: hypothetical protein ACLFSL_03810 [Candidatus Woesearchaeota archaeon]
MRFSSWFLLLSVIMIINITPVYAFFVPGSLQLLGTALSNLFIFLLIAAGAFLLSMAITIKSQIKKHKFLMMTTGALICLIVIIAVASDYSELARMNQPESELVQQRSDTDNTEESEPATETKGKSELEIDGRYLSDENFTIMFYDGGEHLRSRDMHFNKTDRLSDIGGRIPELRDKIEASTDLCFTSHREHEKKCVEDSEKFNLEDCTDNKECFRFILFEILLIFGQETRLEINEADLQTLTDDHVLLSTFDVDEHRDIFKFAFDDSIPRDVAVRIYLEGLDTDKFFERYENESVVVFCYGGSTASTIANVMRLHGLEAYSVGLREITNEELLNLEGLKKINEENSIIINHYQRRYDDKEDILLKFGDLGYCGNWDEDKVPFDIINHDEKNLDIDEAQIRDSNLLCSSDLECKMLQYWIYDNGFTDVVDEIYLLDPDPEFIS